MTEVQPTLNRGQFIRNAAKGSLTLVGAGGVLASMDGVAFAKGASKSDVATLQVRLQKAHGLPTAHPVVGGLEHARGAAGAPRDDVGQRGRQGADRRWLHQLAGCFSRGSSQGGIGRADGGRLGRPRLASSQTSPSRARRPGRAWPAVRPRARRARGPRPGPGLDGVDLALARQLDRPAVGSHGFVARPVGVHLIGVVGEDQPSVRSRRDRAAQLPPASGGRGSRSAPGEGGSPRSSARRCRAQTARAAGWGCSRR